jgi:hypothetical protein
MDCYLSLLAPGLLFYGAFLTIALPQHIRGTLQALSDPDLQVQVFFTANSRPQVLQIYRSPFFMSQQFAMENLLWFLFCFGVMAPYPLLSFHLV